MSSIPQHNIDVNIGNEATLDCSTIAFPPPTVIWSKNNEYISANQHNKALEKNGQILRISDINILDAGHYKCIVKNPAGEISNEFELHVSGNMDNICF